MYGKDEVQDGKMSSKRFGLFLETARGRVYHVYGDQVCQSADMQDSPQQHNEKGT